MPRYMLRLSYLGTNYRGSQKHCANGIIDLDSIQGATETALARVLPKLNHKPIINLAGRTDIGVHALCTAAHVDIYHNYSNLNETYIVKMTNRYLTKTRHDIRIFSFHQVSQNFDARRSAKSRTYLYRFVTAKDPNCHTIPIAESNRSFFIHMKNQVDIEKLKKGLDLFRGKRDFRTFSAKNGDSPEIDNIRSYRRVLDVSLEETTPLMPFDPLSDKFNYYHLTFTSRSFFYNQIRRITGALIALSTNIVSENDIKTMLQIPSHYNWNPRIAPAPPQGLYLKNVEYDEELTREIKDEDCDKIFYPETQNVEHEEKITQNLRN